MAMSIPATLLHPLTPASAGGPVSAIAPASAAAMLAAGDNAMPLPFSQPLAAQAQAASASPAASATALQDAAAMRPDQLMLARQVAYPALKGDALANNWRATVRTYGALTTAREIQASSGQLSPAQLAAGQEGRPVRAHEQHGAPADAWRFTVHTGERQAHTLHVVPDERTPGHGRRRRAALRLVLELEDGLHIVVQVKALPGGVAIDLCAPERHYLERLQALQPVLEAAIAKAGVRVVRWNLRDTLPIGRIHASAALAEAAEALTEPVFRALAELALALPRSA